MLRAISALALLVLAAPAAARDGVPLSPIGLPFGPDTPRRLPADHPLHAAIALAGVEALPAKLGPARREAFAAAVTDTLRDLDMLAADSAAARFRLTPVWIALDSPFRISFASHATARLGWRLTRVDTGATIFTRDIATAAEASGGSATERRSGIAKVALMTNIASAAVCLDKAAYGRAPDDCALTPRFTYHAPMPDLIFIYRH